MKKIILLNLFVLWSVASSATFTNTKTVKNPMRYAVVQSKMYAEGDSNNSAGWMDCKKEDDARTLKLLCFGTREILAHGGHMSKVQFECGFFFKQTSFNSYTLLSEECN